MSDYLTNNHIPLEVGSRVTFPRQGKDSTGVIIEFLPKGGMSELYYVVRGESGAVYRFQRQDRVAPFPEVGFPATTAGYSDQYPHTVVKVSPSGKTIELREDRAEYAGREGHGGPGGADSNVWKYLAGDGSYTKTFRLRKDGTWGGPGGRYGVVGMRQYYYDYTF